MPFRIAAVLLSAAVLSAAGLPKQGPTPETRPGTENAAPVPEQDKDAPVPQTKPKDEAPAKPAMEEKDKAPEKTDAEKKEEQGPPLPIQAENEKDHAACLADLKAIGATFEEVPKINDGSGCGIDKPLKLSMVLPGIVLKPEGTIRCETALELARWTKESVLPAANTALAEEGQLTTINQASSYICRLRNNAKTGKISEHARGNAIDIASFTFKSGKTIAIEPRDEDSTLSGAFQRAVTAAGCLYFETVLDPGSDEAHENHLHFDVLQRRGGYRYCR